jgi:hypothetical protein
MDLNLVASEIREILNSKRKELGLTFVEDTHTYSMKNEYGQMLDTWPSVSTILKLFYDEFPADEIAERKSNGDPYEKERLLKEWSGAGEYASNMGSRVHYFLEKKLIGLYGDYKEVRKPIFEVDIEQELKGNSMINAGEKYIKTMMDRGAVLLDTESILGHPELGYTGQPDKVWLMFNQDKTSIGIVITDWKTNKEKNFKETQYTVPMKPPFNNYPSTSLGHYYLQLPFYAKLLIKMLEGSKYENIKFFGGVIVLLKENSDFEEFRIPKDIISTIFEMDIKQNYYKKYGR